MAAEPTLTDAKNELIACLNEQVAQQKALIEQQANAISAAKR